MSPSMTSIIIISIVGLSFIAIRRYAQFKNARSFGLQLLILIVASALLYQLFYTPNAPTPRGDDDGEIFTIIVLFIFMVLGMLASYLYQHFSKPKAERQKQEFDVGLFIAPVFVSPIVFIPLLVAFQEGNLTLAESSTARIMFFLVAFQNGFLWKEYFDNLRKKTAEGM